MTTFQELQQLNDLEITQRYMNCVTTYYECAGHHKAYMNEHYKIMYRVELRSRRLDVPSKQHCFEYGKFNGEGTY